MDNLTREKKQIYIEGLYNGTLSLQDVAELTGMAYDSVRKMWTGALGGKAVMELKLQSQRDDGIATRKIMRDNTRRFEDLSYLAELFEKRGQERFIPVTHQELLECEYYDSEYIAILSDLHIGQEYDNAMGYYNVEIANDRVDDFANHIIRNVDSGDRLHVFLLGDLIENMHLHNSSALETRMNNIEQTEHAIDIISKFIYKLYEAGIFVDYYFVSGNHSRLNKKDSVLRDERFDDLIKWVLEREFKHLEYSGLINFHDNNEPTIIDTEIAGERVVGVHGDFDKNINRLKSYTGNPDIILKGHTHVFNIKEEDECTTVTNGCICGCGNNYLVEARLRGKSEQTLLEITRGIGITKILPRWWK